MKLHILVGFVYVICSYVSPVYSNEMSNCGTRAQQSAPQMMAEIRLPKRDGPRIKTSGRVPHIQLGVSPVAQLNDRLLKFAFSLPGLIQRPTIVSLPGGTGMWLADDVNVAHPEVIVAGREFAHIHADGSLHAPLPLERALELEKMGWGERHPWAESNEGWEGLVMLFSAGTEDELNILLQLITESYNYVTGRAIEKPAC